MRNIRWIVIALAAASLLILAACGGSDAESSGPGKAIEGFLQAMVDRDENAVIDFTCTAWEKQARVEYDAFAAVKLEAKDISCHETEKVENYTLVTCSGSIVANYGSEDLTIDVAERTYQTVEENGRWRMCGYH